MGRRGENIRKRGDGRWEARIITGYDSGQRAVYHSVYGKTYSEVKKKKNLWLESHFTERTIQPQDYQSQIQITFEEVCTEWLEFKRPQIKESSYAHYVHIIRKHLLPELGAKYFSSITTANLNQLLQTKLWGTEDCQSNLAPKTVSDIRTVLIQIIEHAKNHKYPSAVTEKLFFPKIKQPNIRVLSKEEQQLLEDYIFQEQSPFVIGILLALYGGLRIGEVCSLKWIDIHPESGLVHISKTLIRIQKTGPEQEDSPKTKLLLAEPKTENATRVIPLPGFITEFIKKFRQCPDIYVITGTTFWMEPRTCLDKYKQILKKAGIDDYNFHALRHTFATRCIETGFDVKSLSEILGHANVNITLQRYVHPSIESKRRQMDKLESLFVRGQNKGQK